MGNKILFSKKSTKRTLPILGVAVVLLSSFISLFSLQLALAEDGQPAVAKVSQNVIDHTKRRSLAEAVEECVSIGATNTRSTSDIQNGRFTMPSSVYVGYLVSPNNGTARCNDIFNQAKQYFGYNDNFSFYCDIGGKSRTGQYAHNSQSQSCIDKLPGHYEIERKSSMGAYNALLRREKSRSGMDLGKNNPVLDYAFAWEYVFNTKACDGKLHQKPAYGNDVKYTFAGVDGNTVKADLSYQSQAGLKAYSLNFHRNGSSKVSCTGMVNTIQKNAAAFAKYTASSALSSEVDRVAKEIADKLEVKNIDKCKPALESALKAFRQSSQNETNHLVDDLGKDTALVKCLVDSYGLDREGVIKALNEVSERQNLEAEVDGEGDEEYEDSCAVDGGLAHVICPIMITLAKIVDGSMSFISENFLEVDSSLINDDKTKEAWNGFKNLANILFVIAFLVIIFSQVSNVGISNYGIKKLLPRLVILAVVVNLSYYISAILVDLSNMLGYGLSNMFTLTGIGEGMQFTTPVDPMKTTLAVLALGAGGAIALWAALPSLIGGLFVGAVALIMVIFMLVARKAIVLLLVIVSPLAFASMILPNTEVLFKKWKELMLGMLLLFPTIGLIWGGSSLASYIITTTSEASVMIEIVGIIILVVPLIAIWPLLKSALNSTGRLGAAINNIGGKVQESTRKYSEGTRLGDLERGERHRRTLVRAGRRTRGVRAWADKTPIGRALRLDRGGYAAQQAVDKEELEAADNIFEYEYGRNAAAALSSDNAMVRVKAIQALKEEGSHGMGILREHYSKGGKITSRREAEELSALKGKDVGLSAFGTAAKQHLDDPEKSNEYHTTLEDYNKGAADLYRGLSTGEKATQVADALESAAAHEYKDKNGVVIGRGGPTAKEAEALINDPRLAERMSGSTLKWYQAIANGSGGSGSGPGSP